MQQTKPTMLQTKPTNDAPNNNQQTEQTKSVNLIKYELRDNTTILFCENFIDCESSKKLFEELSELDYEQPILHMYGKDIKIPRLQAWYANHGITNRQARLYQKQQANEWSGYIKIVKEHLEKCLECEFNYCLVNYYRDGNDYISYHSDDEAFDNDKNIIASISLGETRNFVLKHNDKTEKYNFMLSNGSLIVMKDDTQKYWKHTITKS